jgi:hypothetical protein
MNISCNDKNVKFLGEKPLVLFSQHSNFMDKIKEFVRFKEEDICQEKIMCLFFSPYWNTRNKGDVTLWPCHLH